MRRTRFPALLLCALGLAESALSAQGPDTTRHAARLLPFDVAGEIAYLYNQAAALRATGDLTVRGDQTVDGNVAVLDGTLTLAGHVTGRALVVNGNAVLRPGARVDGDVIVVGGALSGDTTGAVGGTTTVHPERMAYHRLGEALVADSVPSDEGWFRRWLRRRRTSQSKLLIKGGTYNRVEGLPVLGGPSLRRNTGFGWVHLEALGIWRSANGFAWSEANRGYDVTADVNFKEPGLGIGVRAYDVVAPVEPWHLRDTEAGLASFLLHRDYRDHYNRHGAAAFATVRGGGPVALTASLGRERWSPRAANAPFSIFRNDRAWRPNPVLDDGTFTLGALELGIDTRDDDVNPTAGWLVAATLEHGWSGSVRLGPADTLVRPAASGPARVQYTTAFVDARRYSRISPHEQVNLRLVAGGWVGGDPLPLERRLSLGGPGALPGYDFREVPPAGDVLACRATAALPGTPAECDRILLAQVEYRGDLRLPFAEHRDPNLFWSFYRPASWVVFVDAGRGWVVGPRADGLRYPAWALPPLGSFRADIGIGVDVSLLGVFVAKSLTDFAESPPNVVVRLRHRF